MALTATATPEVKDDIIKQLGLSSPKIVVTGFARPNLQMGVIHANEGQKMQYVLDAISSMDNPSGIVYASTRAPWSITPVWILTIVNGCRTILFPTRPR